MQAQSLPPPNHLKGENMFSDKELEATKDYINSKKADLLNNEGGSDLDYIQNLQTLIQLENAVDEKMGERKTGL